MVDINYTLIIYFQNLPSGSSRVGAIKLTYISKVGFLCRATRMRGSQSLGTGVRVKAIPFLCHLMMMFRFT